MLKLLMSVFVLVVFYGCGGGSERADVKVKGLARSEARVADDSIQAIKVLNVPTLAEYELSGDQLAKSVKSQTCVSMPEIPVSMEQGALAPSLSLVTTTSAEQFKFARLKAKDLKREAQSEPQLTSLQAGESGRPEIVMSETSFFQELGSSNQAEPIALELYRVTSNGNQYEGCLLIRRKLVAAEPIVRYASVPRGIDQRVGLGNETNYGDALQIFVTNPNNFAIAVNFSAVAVDSRSDQALVLCHRADPNPHNRCWTQANYDVTLAAGGSTSFGINGAFTPEERGNVGRFRTVGVRVQFNTRASFGIYPYNHHSTQTVDLY